MTLKHEFDYYISILDKEKVEHIKKNYNYCNFCKSVADMHTVCVRMNETASATFFIEAMKEYLSEYDYSHQII
jgi:hypothetical protein